MAAKNSIQHTMPHNGSLVYNKVVELQITNTAIANVIGRSSVTVGGYFKEPSLHSRILWQLGNALNYNFFKQLSDSFDEGEVMRKTATQTEEIAKLQQQIEEQKLRIRELEIAVNAYKDVLRKS